MRKFGEKITVTSDVPQGLRITQFVGSGRRRGSVDTFTSVSGVLEKGKDLRATPGYSGA